jgi:hypothetical protein
MAQMSAQDTFVQNAKAGSWNTAADLLNGSPMYDILPFLAALGTDSAISANNIAGILRNRGWFGAAQRISWAGDVVRLRTVPNPPPGLPDDQVEDARKFLNSRKAAGGGAQSRKLANGKYTTNPNEVVTTTTTPTPRLVLSALKANWPQLTDTGARTLTAQFLFETNGGRSCFNWNLGNTKGKENEPHYYLVDVPECWPQAVAQGEVATGGGLARIATKEDIARLQIACSKTPVVYNPPHHHTRFRAYASLEDGAKRWVGHHQYIASKFPGYLDALNEGNISEVVQNLGPNGYKYFTGDQGVYASGMTRWKSTIDSTVPL